jgi:hypothetical protein
MDLNTNEIEWTHRMKKREDGVRAVKSSPEYVEMLIMLSTGEMDEAERPLSPEPVNRTLSKRTWEQGMMTWRDNIKVSITSSRLSRSTDVCFAKCLRFMGYLTAFGTSNPFCALSDGNRMLAPLGFGLAPWFSKPDEGDYMMWQRHGHFLAIVCHSARESGTLRYKVFDGSAVRAATDLKELDGALLYKVVPEAQASYDVQFDVQPMRCSEHDRYMS